MSDAFWKYPTIEIVVADKGYNATFGLKNTKSI